MMYTSSTTLMHFFKVVLPCVDLLCTRKPKSDEHKVYTLATKNSESYDLVLHKAVVCTGEYC